MRALRVERSVARFAAARLASELGNGGAARIGPLRLVETDAPDLPGADWLRVRPSLSGICGSDLATLDARSSRWFEDIVSFPFVPGHEVVGVTEDGRRVVVNPVLACVARGLSPLCPQCAAGHPNRCERLTGGTLPPGLQVGYCAGTGGGWSGSLVAHTSSVIEVPDGLSDEAAVLVEPVASAIHGALTAPSLAGAAGAAAFGAYQSAVPQVSTPQNAAETTAVVIGAGMQGLATIAALARFRPDVDTIIAVAKHPEQRHLARELGATVVAEPGEIRRAVRRRCGGWMLDSGQLTAGAPLVIDCVGSASSLADALAVTAPGGTIVLIGMPGRTTVDLTPLWQREINLRGAYTYGPEHAAGPTPGHEHPGAHTFELAFDLVGHAGLERLLSATYPLDHYVDAIGHAANAGRRGAVKVAFDLRGEKKR
jgi:threonine dehydrogenase-like Zn-dependent dehydrogenase